MDSLASLLLLLGAFVIVKILFPSQYIRSRGEGVRYTPPETGDPKPRK